MQGAESQSRTHRAFATVTISVLDINDHIPTFEQQIYLVNVSELAQINDSVIELTAFDRDEVYKNNLFILTSCKYKFLISGCIWTL